MILQVNVLLLHLHFQPVQKQGTSKGFTKGVGDLVGVTTILEIKMRGIL